MKKSRLHIGLFVALCALALTLSSCSSPEKCLKGDWNATSFSVNGQETLKKLLTSFTMKFEALDGDAGAFTFKTVSIRGVQSTETGEYSIVDDGETQIELIFSTGEKTLLRMDCDSGELNMEGTLDGAGVVISAQKE